MLAALNLFVSSLTLVCVVVIGRHLGLARADIDALFKKIRGAEKPE